MNNLKRVLSLALASVMLIGMMVVGASATNAEDFTDASEITHTEAVSIATALNIINGKEDGSYFDPTGEVTRAEMAKMITRAMYGGKDPVLGVKATPTFTDIKGNWAESYIEYCASAGIINGRGDGTFDPAGLVTGTEAAKMLLVALGYDTDVYELTGIDWAINTNRIANQIDCELYDDLSDLDPTLPLNRDNTAQMVYNALNAKTKEMTPTSSKSGEIEYTYTTSSPLLYKKYGAVRVEAVVTANEFNDNSESMKGKTTIDLSNNDELEAQLGDGVNDTPTIEFATGKDEIGKALVFYIKPSSANKTNLGKGTVVNDSVILSEDNAVFTTTGVFPKVDNVKTLNSFAKKNGLKFGDAYVSYTNYAEDDEAIATTATNARGTEVTIIDNDADGIVDVVLKNTYAFGQVTKYNTSGDGSVTVKTAVDSDLVPSSEKLKNIVAYEGIAKDDYVNVTKVADTYYINKAVKVEGVMTAYKADRADSTVTVDSKTYNVSANAAYTEDLKAFYYKAGDDDVYELVSKDYLKEDMIIYLDQFGYAIAGDSDAATDFLFVANATFNDTATSVNSGTVTAYVYFEDGTYGSYVINKIDDEKAITTVASQDDADELKGLIFKYSTTSDNKLNLTSIEDSATVEEVEYKKGASTLAEDKYITSDTVTFFVKLDVVNGVVQKTIDTVTVYTGKTLPGFEITGGGAAAYDNGFVKNVTVVPNDNTATNMDVVLVVTGEGASSSDWLYLVKYVETNDDGDVFWAVVDGALEKINLNEKLTTKSTTGAYKYAMDGSLYDLGGVYEGHVGSGIVSLVDSSSIVVDDEYKVSKSTVIVYLDGADTDVDAKVAKKDYVEVVYNTNNGDKEAEAIFIVEEYDDTNHEILEYADTVEYDGNEDVYTVPSTADTVAKVKALFTVSPDSTVLLLADEPDDATTVGALGEDVEEIEAGTPYYLVVIAGSAADDSTDYTVYTVNVAAE